MGRRTEMGRLSVRVDELALEGAGELCWRGRSWFRKRQPRRAPESWEFDLLRLIIDQYAIPSDQLARFLGASVAEAEAVVEHLSVVGYVDYDRVLWSESPWVWLTKRGAYYSRTGFQTFPPNVGAMDRIRAVNEVRLMVEERGGDVEWVSQRKVIRRYGRRGARVHGLVEVGVERHAVKVELVRKSRAWTEGAVAELLRRYDALAVFCGAPTRGLFRELEASGRYPGLVVRDVPGSR